MNPLTTNHARCTFFRALCFVCGILFLSAGAAKAQLIYADSFNYPNGEIVGAAGSPWVNNYLPADGANVVSRRLFLTQSNEESIRYDFPTSFGTGFLYSRMTVNFSKLPVGNGNYFAFLRAAGTDNLRCRIWASTNGAAPGGFRLGLTAISAPPLMIAQDLFPGSNYLVVCRYTLSNSFCSLWIDPADENSTDARVDCTVDAGQWSIGHFGFLQTAYYDSSGSYFGELTVDDLRIGRSFADASPSVIFTAITNAPSGGVSLSALGRATTNYILQATTDLASTNWLNLSTNAADATGNLNLSDTNTANFSSRFYRLLKQ